MLIPETIKTAHDRRKRFRFQMDAELRYEIAVRGRHKGCQQIGRAVDITSKSLAFRTDGPPIEHEMRLNVSLAWPAQLGDCMLRLAFEGAVLRTRGNLVVVSIERPEFRTAGKA